VALAELGRGQEARNEATRLLAQMPRMTAEQFGSTFADTATALRQRRIAAAQLAGFPLGAGASSVPGPAAPK